MGLIPATHDMLVKLSASYKIRSKEVNKLLAYSKGEVDGSARTYDTATDYIIALDRYLHQVNDEYLEKPYITKEGVRDFLRIARPKLLITFLSYIGHTQTKWKAAKEKSEAHKDILEQIELFFAADGTEKALTGIYAKDVALKVLPIVLAENEDKKDEVNINVTVNGEKVSLI